MATKTKDEIIRDLLKTVNDKKAAILKAEKPSWETNLSYSFTGEGNNLNLQVQTDISLLVSMLANLIQKKGAFDEAAKELGVTATFKHQGFTFDQWKNDIQCRINKVEIAKKKKEIEDIEGRLNKLISPEERERIELEALAASVAELG